MAISFSDLQQVVAVVLADRPASHPWLRLSDGTALCAQPGPALVFTAQDGQWMVPVHDATLIAEIINLRRHRYQP